MRFPSKLYDHGIEFHVSSCEFVDRSCSLENEDDPRNHTKRRQILQLVCCIAALIILEAACGKKPPQLERAELSPLLKENDLTVSVTPESKKDVVEIEELDAALYSPIAGTTLYLKSPSPTFDSRDMTPHYWLRVEDYATPDAAAKRAAEYKAVGTYDRLAKAYGKASSFMISKTTVREWALAKGRRVYALTTDAYLFTLIEKPEALRKSIAALPEK